MPWETPIEKPIQDLVLINTVVMGSLQDATDAAAELLADAVRAGARRDTGELIAEIGTQGYQPKEKDARATRVTTGPFYKRFLEKGTSRMPAYPFILPAYAATKRSIEKALEVTIEAGIQKAIK
jgi:HK97 gp10 family phage protein